MKHWQKPHIRQSAGRYHCTGQGISVDGVTASGAWIGWCRQAALKIICRADVLACCAKSTETPSAAFSLEEATNG